MDNIISYGNISDVGNTRKIIVNYTVLIFGVIVILIFLLLGIYYLSPNNYLILKWEDNKFKLEKTIECIIKPDSNLLIDLKNNDDKYLKNNDDKYLKNNDDKYLKNIDDKYLKFSESINLVINNSFKSQSIIFNKDIDLIKSQYNSDIFIVNNSDIEKKITLQYYSII
jgi:hypothetical protein